MRNYHLYLFVLLGITIVSCEEEPIICWECIAYDELGPTTPLEYCDYEEATINFVREFQYGYDLRGIDTYCYYTRTNN